jgi:transglutaminase-like putative cysteine protease
MELIQRNRDEAYLQYDQYVDYDNPIVADKAAELTRGCKTSFEKIENIYHFVRDEIVHTIDANDSTITISASQVLEQKTGLSYSKANLLAALMRASGIYTGFCYQRIKLFSHSDKLQLHALNAIYEPDLKKWIRLDARGNNYKFDAEFTLTERQLGYTIHPELGEFEFNDLIAVPLPSTMACLERSTNAIKMYYNDLPDYND